MLAIMKRLIFVAIGLIISIIIIHRTKARSPYYLPNIQYKVACILNPTTKSEEDAIDKKLKDCFHIAHTSQESNGKQYRCYFRFPVGDIACMPPSIAQRNIKVRGCPRFIATEETNCFFLDNKYRSFFALLKSNAPVSIKLYQGKIVKKWQDIRDELLKLKHKKTIDQPLRAAIKPGV